MFLPQKTVEEYQEIYKKKIGNISFEEARVKAENFNIFFDLITKSLK